MTNQPSETTTISRRESFIVLMVSRACKLSVDALCSSKLVRGALHPSTALMIFAVGLLGWTVFKNAPGGAGWSLFWEESASWFTKLRFLALIYLWPAVLAFIGIVLFQLQFRLSMSGAGIRTVFSICVIGSLTMLTSLRTLSHTPNSSPAYVFGMALGYTTMGRVYAVQMWRLWNRIPLPWIVWRGNVPAVRELERAMRERLSRSVPQPQAATSVADQSGA